MRKKNKVLFGGLVAALACVLAFVLVGCGSTSSDTKGSNNNASSSTASKDDKGSDKAADLKLVENGKLTCVAELGFAPFESMDEKTGEPEGFDIDVSKAIAKKMGLEANWLPNQKFDTLVPLIKQGGKADISISGITVTDDRKEEVDFTDPYLDSNQAIVIKSDSSETEDSLNASGKKIACQAGTTGEEWIKENLPNATCVPLDDVTAGLTGVQTDSYNAFVIDLPVASNMIKNSFTDLKVAKEIPTGEQYAIIVSKDNPALKDAVNKALKEIQDDGTMAEIKKKWFGDNI